MSRVQGPRAIARLFCATIGRRLVLSFVRRSPAEALDADGRYRTLIDKRPSAENAVERADFAEVHYAMNVRGEIPGTKGLVGPIFLLVLMLVLAAWSAVSYGLRAFPFMLFPPTIGAVVLGTRWWTLRTTLEARENVIFAGWLRQGCCPHCAYRLPRHEPAARVRCTECGVQWKMPEHPA